MSKRSVFRAIGSLRDSGFVDQRTPYRLTSAGEEAVGDDL
jgi:hypothetical protein